MFSKMFVTCMATQPEAATIWVVIGKAIATVPTVTLPRCQSTMAKAPVAVISRALSTVSVNANMVFRRSEAWKRPVCWSMASRT